MKYLIIDSKTELALYGVDRFTLLFNDEQEALNIARQFFRTDKEFFILSIKLRG